MLNKPNRREVLQRVSRLLCIYVLHAEALHGSRGVRLVRPFSRQTAGPHTGPRIEVRVTLSSFRATTRNPGIFGQKITQDTRAMRPYSSHRHLQKLDPASNAGDTTCSFFSAARRTNQEAPPLLSGFIARRLAPPSGAAELAALRQSSPSCRGRLASSRPDKGGGITALHREYSGHIATRASRIYRRLCHSALDAAIMSFRATTRNPEIPGHGITQDARTVRHYSTHCHLQKLDPASSAG